jgi:hypothetical protein
MAIGGENLTIGRNGTIAAAIGQLHRTPFQAPRHRSRQGESRNRSSPDCPAAGRGAGLAFQPERVVQARPSICSRRRCRSPCRRSAGGGGSPLPSPGAQPVEVGLHGFGAGQDDQVARRHRHRARADQRKSTSGCKAQRVEVVVVGDARVGRRDTFSAAPAWLGGLRGSASSASR